MFAFSQILWKTRWVSRCRSRSRRLILPSSSRNKSIMQRIQFSAPVLRIVAVVLMGVGTGRSLLGDDLDRLQVGMQPDGRIVVPTNQLLKPAGKQITFPGRPVDLAFAEDGRVVVVKNRYNLVFIDTT